MSRSITTTKRRTGARRSAANPTPGPAARAQGQPSREPARADPAAEAAQSGVLGKALSILELIAQAREPMSIADLVRASGLTKPTAHRITTILSEMGYIEREPTRRGYVVGERLVDLSIESLAASAPRSIRRAILRTLSETVGETCNFGVLSGSEIIYLDRVEAKWPLGLRFEAGSRVPAHCTALGKLLLAQLNPRDRRNVIAAMPLTRYTSRTLTHRDALADAIEKTRLSGVGVDNQEFIEGVVCVSVPVSTREGKIIGGIAMSAPEARISLDDAMARVPAMREAAQRLGATYSYGKA